jgi:hypothetical protein
MLDLSLISLSLTGNRGLKQIVSCEKPSRRESSCRMQPLVPPEPAHFVFGKPHLADYGRFAVIRP